MKITDDRARDLLCWLDDMAGDHTMLFDEMTMYRDAAALIRQLQAAEQAAWHAGLDAGREQGRSNRLAEAATHKRELDSAGAFHFSDNGDDIEARIAQQPAAVDEAMVFRLAVWMAKHDGCEDPHRLIYEGTPPVPWGEVWNRYEYDARAALTAALAAQQPAATGEESSKGADVAQPKRRRYDPSGSLSEYGVFPECDAQQPVAGEEIMVNAAHDVYTLPLQPSGLSSGPRFVVHVPGPEQPAAVDGEEGK